MSRFKKPLVDALQARLHDRPFAVQIQFWNLPEYLAGMSEKILRAAQVIQGISQKYYRAAIALKPLGRDLADIFDDSDHADNRGWEDAPALSLVVEADVSAGDGRAKCESSFRNAIDRLTELPHDLWPLRRSKVQAISQGDGSGAACGKVAARFRYGQPRPRAWIEVAIPRIGVEAHGQRSPRFFDPKHGGVGARHHNRVGPHHVVVLMVNPLLARNVWRRQDLYK